MDKAILAGDSDASERRPGFRAAGASVARFVAPVVARHGGGMLARLKAEWAAIAGDEVAGITWPESLARGGTLRLRVTPARALEIQHRAPLVIERINLFFGREAVTRLALIQGPLPLAPPPQKSLRTLEPGESAALERQLEGVADPGLRDALTRLGRSIIARPD